MNRSQRRAPVIAWSIAAGLLCIGGGAAAAGSAIADAGSTAGEDVGRPGTRDGVSTSSPRQHGRGMPANPQHGTERACSWPVIRPDTPPDFGAGRNSGLIGGPTPNVIPLVPMPTMSAAIEPPVTAPAPVSAPESVVVENRSGPGPTTDAVPMNPGFVAAPGGAVPAPVAPRFAPSPPAALAPRHSAPTPVRRDVNGSVPAATSYPGDFANVDLANVDLSKAMATALPGLAAMAAMTTLGGVVGYRQAKAGYLLHAAGAGRYVR